MLEQLKNEMVESGVYKELKKTQSNLYSEMGLNFEQFKSKYGFNGICELIERSEDEIKAFIQLYKSERKKVNHIITKLKFYKQMGFKAVFGTLTFNNESMKKYNQTTRHKKVLKSLNESGLTDYVLNIDYGGKTDREHYHFIGWIRNEFETITEWRWFENKKQMIKVITNMPIEYNLGFSAYEPIEGLEDQNGCNVAKYMNKLSMHSLKNNRMKLTYKKCSPFKEYEKRKRDLMRVMG